MRDELLKQAEQEGWKVRIDSSDPDYEIVDIFSSKRFPDKSYTFWFRKKDGSLDSIYSDFEFDLISDKEKKSILKEHLETLDARASNLQSSIYDIQEVLGESN